MARTPSNMLELGTRLPSFELPNTLNKHIISSDEIAIDKALVIMFICNHCPFVIHLHEGLQKLYKDYKNQGVHFIAISSNDVVNYPQDAPPLMKELFETLKLDFPYLYDESQSVAKLFDAACTPDFYIFDNEKVLAYRGQFDDSRPNSDIPVTGTDMRTALDDLINGAKVSEEQKPSLGCNIKWK